VPNKFKALAASVGLSVLFLAIYGWTNWFTAQRANVGTIFFEWERHLPFVPWFIVPYMSIDLFFVVAPFLCRTREELRTFVWRIAAAILVAGLCFLAFPLRFGFERPATGGWLGAVFDWFRTMDAPHNLFPSLHITLGALLLVTYARHTRGVWRLLVAGWFVLVWASAVLTHQHHLLDVVGGFALAGYCFYFIRETQPRLPVISNHRIGSYYTAGAVALLANALLLWPWGAVLLWPVVSLGIVVAAYFGAGPAIFRKRDGVLPWSTVWALGPVLVGQHLSRVYYRRQCSAWNEVTPNVWIGSALSNREAERAVQHGVTAVLDVTAEFTAPRAFRSLTYRNIQVLDLTAPTTLQLQEMAEFIEAQSRSGIVYVHCKIGYSRSAAAAGAWLLASGRAADVDEAVAKLRAVRSSIVVRPEVHEALVIFCSRSRSSRVSNAIPHRSL
jgi:predicted protein tyrosine phosphatase/membrane-associated phospholipid phosphatase